MRVTSSYGTIFVDMSDGSTCRIPANRETTYAGVLEDCPHSWAYRVEEAPLNMIQALALTAELTKRLVGESPPDRVFTADVILTSPNGRSFTLTHTPQDQRGGS